MANFEWQFDAPSGVFKNHSLSSDLRSAAIAEAKFVQFCRPEPGYGRKMGENITIARVSNLTVPTSGQLSEGVKIPEDDLTISSVGITVVEWGRAVPYTSLSDDLGKYDMNSMVQKELMKQMKLVMDGAAATAFKAAKVCAIPTGISYADVTFDTDGTPSTQALVNLTVGHVERIRDYMYATLNVPGYGGGDEYIAIVSNKAARGIKSDADWQDWHKYTDPEAKFKGEIGKLEGIRFIEQNNTGALSNGVGSGSILGEGIFFGDDAVAMVVAVDPELRAGIPGDFGRQKAVAWYGVMQFGEVFNTANAGEARIVRLTSS